MAVGTCCPLGFLSRPNLLLPLACCPCTTGNFVPCFCPVYKGSTSCPPAILLSACPLNGRPSYAETGWPELAHTVTGQVSAGLLMEAGICGIHPVHDCVKYVARPTTVAEVNVTPRDVVPRKLRSASRYHPVRLPMQCISLHPASCSSSGTRFMAIRSGVGMIIGGGPQLMGAHGLLEKMICKCLLQPRHKSWWSPSPGQ